MTVNDAEPAGPGRVRQASAQGAFAILAQAAQADERTRVLKHGDTFAVFDHYGDIKPTGLGEEGLYHEGTRFLSCLLLGLNGGRPLFLSSTVKEDNDVLTVDLSNPDTLDGDHPTLVRGTLHLFRSKFLWQGICYERLRVKNYGLAPAEAALVYHFEADFADIFEVRGTRRARKGRRRPGEAAADTVTLAYEGLDRVVRRTRLEFRPVPHALTATEAQFHIRLAPREETTLYLTVTCDRGRIPAAYPPYDAALSALDAAARRTRDEACRIRSSSEPFDAWLARSTADLHMMTTETSEGPYPYAGVPWFSTPFGRDGLLTAFSCLWFNPELARGVLAYLAATQADCVDPARDAEPGKILHETRGGEMAALGEIPFGRYYGSVDATPLFVVLGAAYLERTDDRTFLASLWPNLERALHWIDRYGDADGDGFVEYARTSPQGLVQQGWKDAHDSVMHADGTLAPAPIALCEVQGYVYAAKRGAAVLADALGRGGRAADLRQQAETLRERFELAFWCDDLGTYALALDGSKRPCRVRSSNAGQCLFAGIADPGHARRVADSLLDPASYSGWGVRTLAATEARYNPMAYHNGSVWPHDNALIAAGLARYGLKDAVVTVTEGLFHASRFMDLHAMPELFCGFQRRPGAGPTLYPVACSPQAWSAAAVFLLLQACLGLKVEAKPERVWFQYPVLPPFLHEVRIENLRVGAGRLDLQLVRHGTNVGINVLRRDGAVDICMIK